MRKFPESLARREIWHIQNSYIIVGEPSRRFFQHVYPLIQMWNLLIIKRIFHSWKNDSSKIAKYLFVSTILSIKWKQPILFTYIGLDTITEGGNQTFQAIPMINKTRHCNKFNSAVQFLLSFIHFNWFLFSFIVKISFSLASILRWISNSVIGTEIKLPCRYRIPISYKKEIANSLATRHIQLSIIGTTIF